MPDEDLLLKILKPTTEPKKTKDMEAKKQKSPPYDRAKPRGESKNKLRSGLNMTLDGLKTKLTNKQKMELIGIAAKYVDD